MDESLSNSREWRSVALLLLIASAMFFLRLDCALLEPEETRYAEIPREMLAAGEWIVPLYHGQPYYDKPPLLYWLVMLSYSAFGVHDWAARLVSGLCGVLTVLATYLWGRRVFDSRVAFFGALVLALMPRFIYLGRFLATDTVLNLGVVVTLMYLHIGINGRRSRWWWLGAGCACGWSLLAKGPVALVLIAPPVLAYLALCYKRGAARGSCGVGGVVFVAVMLAIAAPWYVMMLCQPGFAEQFFWKHHVLRFVEPFDHVKPFWFYLPDLLVGTLPWCLLLIPAAARLYRQSGNPPPGFAGGGQGGGTALLPLLAAVWCLLFFSASGCKRVGYVLPLFAPLALVIGNEIVLLLNERRLSRKFLSATSAATCALLLLGVGFVLPWYNERFSLRQEVESVRAQMPHPQNVVCYPRGWDSVPFYLDRNAVPVFTSSQQAELTAYLHNHDDTVLFTRDDSDSLQLQEELRLSLTLEPIARQGPHQAIRVRHNDFRPALAYRGEDK